jgi:hypothetical protein
MTILEMYEKEGRQLTHMGLATLSSKIFFSTAEFICHIFSLIAILCEK